jgi:uncharacterized protein (TIGR02145 family)
MKKLLIFLLTFFVVLFITFSGCKKEEKSKTELPTLSTLAATEITSNEAKGGGNISSDGGAPITARGVVWAKTSSPTLEQHEGITNDGIGTGLFNSTLTGLMSDTTYYVRSFATNRAGTAYGQQVQFRTEAAGESPVSAFTATPISGKAPLTVNFSDQSANEPTSWQWDFGDGNSSNQQCPQNTYQNAGNYTVQLIVSNEHGSDTLIKANYILVNETGSAPISSFTATPTHGSTPVTVHFTDHSINEPKSWLWNFGDGNTSTEQNPIYTYYDIGYFNVSLTTINDYGSNTETKENFIIIFDALFPPSKPVNVYAGDWSQGYGVYWTDQSDNETSFRIYKATNSLTDFQEFSTVAANVTFFADYQYNPENYYAYRITAFNGDGESALSNLAVVPQRPIIHSDQIGPDAITISWTCPPDCQMERVYIERSTSPSGGFMPVGYEVYPKTSFVDNTVVLGVNYYYRAQAAWVSPEADHISKSIPTEIIGPLRIGIGGIPCPDIPNFVYGGQTYNTVLIGEQCWMKENLNYETGGSWCYNNDTANCTKYGRLYVQFSAESACPPGWHLPTDEEWKILEANVDSKYGPNHNEWNELYTRGYDVGKKLKAISDWGNNGNGTDDYGFAAFPGGIYVSGNFYSLGYVGKWWTSTKQDKYDYYWQRQLNSNSDASTRTYVSMYSGYSVRCLKD